MFYRSVRHKTTAALRKVSQALKRIVAYKQEYRCKKCEQLLPPCYEVDHIVPIWKFMLEPEKYDFDVNCESNLQALCNNCHSLKTYYEGIDRTEIKGNRSETRKPKFQKRKSYVSRAQKESKLKPKQDKPTQSLQSFYFCKQCNNSVSIYFDHKC